MRFMFVEYGDIFDYFGCIYWEIDEKSVTEMVFCVFLDFLFY